MNGSLEQVFSQVVMACSVAALAAIAMREATTDKTLHICARVLGMSAWCAMISLAWFSVREYERLERVMIVRQSTKVAEPAVISRTEMELPSGIVIGWTHACTYGCDRRGSGDTGRDFSLSGFRRQDGGSWTPDREPDADAGRSGWKVQGMPGEPVGISSESPEAF